MKNILKIKKLSSALLVGTIMTGISQMNATAAFELMPEYKIHYLGSGANSHKVINFKAFPCLVVNKKEGVNEIMVNYYEKSDDEFESKISSEDQGRYFYNGEEIEGSTRIGNVHPNGDNILVVYNGNPNKTAAEIWEETEHSRGQILANNKLVDLDSKEEEELGEANLYRKETIGEYPHIKTDKYKVTFINGQKVDENGYFGDYENPNGDNSVIVYTSSDPNALPQ